MNKIDVDTMGRVLASQRNEITEYYIYSDLARITKDPNNKKTLQRVANEEKEHYKFWKRYSGKDVSPNRFNIWKYTLISRIFGITFGIKLMEIGEKNAQVNYDLISKKIPAAKWVEGDEAVHEKRLIGLIDEERLRYASSMVLGLNDALVELTGALAGFTFAIQNAQIIAAAGAITGIAAAMSMASSEYLSTKTEKGGPVDNVKEKSVAKGKIVKFEKDPVKAAAYTGVIYLIAVFLLILPYLFLNNLYLSLAVMIGIVLVVIFAFTFYLSVAKELPFWKRFFETAGISLGIAAISFGIGIFVRTVWGIQI
jgi:VIT1/CCC1 family predicted Fe2+/Mn2+ transporter